MVVGANDGTLLHASTPRMAMKADASCLRWSLTPSSRPMAPRGQRYSGHCTQTAAPLLHECDTEIRDVGFQNRWQAGACPGCRPIGAPCWWLGRQGGRSFAAMDVTHIRHPPESDVGEGNRAHHPDMGFSWPTADRRCQQHAGNNQGAGLVRAQRPNRKGSPSVPTPPAVPRDLPSGWYRSKAKYPELPGLHPLRLRLWRDLDGNPVAF